MLQPVRFLAAEETAPGPLHAPGRHTPIASRPQQGGPGAESPGLPLLHSRDEQHTVTKAPKRPLAVLLRRP